jgi:hypothetical protein
MNQDRGKRAAFRVRHGTLSLMVELPRIPCSGKENSLLGRVGNFVCKAQKTKGKFDPKIVPEGRFRGNSLLEHAAFRSKRIGELATSCHGRPCACHLDRKGRVLTDRDGRDKPGHDKVERLPDSTKTQHALNSLQAGNSTRNEPRPVRARPRRHRRFCLHEVAAQRVGPRRYRRPSGGFPTSPPRSQSSTNGKGPGKRST